MSIPLYFAMNWKESVNSATTHRAQLGFGFQADGTLLLPEERLEGAPIVLHDAVAPPKRLSGQTMDVLIRCCRFGCFCDFERPCSQAHLKLLSALREALGSQALLVVPEEYGAHFPDVPVLVAPGPLVHNWESCFRTAGRRHGNAWFLELEPCRVQYRSPIIQKQETLLPGCLCKASHDGEKISYRDTEDTLQKKLSLAQACGCRGALALYREWQDLALELPG